MIALATGYDFSGLMNTLRRAARCLSRPGFDFDLCQGGLTVRYRIKGKYPGTAVVTDGKPYGNNRFYGSVSKGGMFYPARQGCPDWVLDFLQGLSDDPAGTVRDYGRKTGACCFCRKPLTDPVSVEAGFGQACSANYGIHEEYKAARERVKDRK